MEYLRFTKEMLRKNTLRIALGVSLAANGVTVFDAGVREGEGIKDAYHTAENIGQAVGEGLSKEFCLNESEPCDNDSNDSYYTSPIHHW